MFEQAIREFPVTVYGGLTQYSNTISKARCRIFYKYENRNGTYITDEFAEKLLSSIPYTPVKGIFDEYVEDYTDHGEKRSEGRIYGIVPENPNLAWEKHLDEDGVEREYACVDVLIYTSLYEEANEIVNKAQSMEIFEPSIKGSWKIINGRKMFEFEDGCFLGLQVLGDDVEPCFEGAAFYTLSDLRSSFQEMVEAIKEFSLKLPELNTGGQLKMPGINFKLSDNQKFEALWTLLNTEYNEEDGWVITHVINEVYDEYALVYNYSEASYERVYYTKDDETDSVAITEVKKVFVIDVTEEEMNALNALRMLNGGTYENANAAFEKVSELEEANSNFEQKIEELNNNISTLETEKEQFTAQLSEANEQITSLTEEVNALNSYKTEVENNEKKAVIESYAELLSEEILAEYSAKIAEYSVVDLDKDLAYELKKNNMSVYTKEPAAHRIPKDLERTGIEAILSKYKK